MIQEIIEKIEREIEIRKNMPHNSEQVDICYGLNRAREIVSSMREDGWIPVTERLPEDKINPITLDAYVYPVTIDLVGATDIRYYSFCGGHWYDCGPKRMDDIVIAWQPLPPTYQRPARKEAGEEAGAAGLMPATKKR